MQFTKLRLSGFKSFVEPAELLVEPGLTGIVGPNGCGKSNLVEALQWVMGETSARRLRGGDMDDVIFAGTSTRPARNLASVTLWLDNSERKAPAPLNDHDELEIDRRIDRSKGSVYRVNGRETRARDVQTLFADSASGAGSVSLIGQGRIGWLINAKPAERRSLLEEAAGIGGLQARRHEAELRLAAAETNLGRLTDIGAAIEAQIERLKKQARQAERYRKLSLQLRHAEARWIYRLWQDQVEKLRLLTERLAAADAAVAAAKVTADAAETVRLDSQAALPALRASDTEAARRVEHLVGRLAALDAEAQRVAAALQDAARRRTQIESDILRENLRVEDARIATDRLAQERKSLYAGRAGEAAAQAMAGAELSRSRAAMAELEREHGAATARAAASEAARAAILKRHAALAERRGRLERQLAEAKSKAAALDLLAVSEAQIAAAERALQDAVTAQAEARAVTERAELAARAAEQEHRLQGAPVQQAERQAMRLGAEIDALRALVSAGLGKRVRPALDQIGVGAGLELALGAALGDDALASLDDGQAVRWVELPPEGTPPEALPEGAEPLCDVVTAPARLDRRLRRIGVVADDAMGDRLQAALHPGQTLVTRAGAVWRWDGLAMTAGAPSAAATRLAQRNRLARLETEAVAAERELAQAKTAERRAAAALEAARLAERAARAAEQRAQQASEAERRAQLQFTQQQGQEASRRRAAAELVERLDGDLTELAAQAAEAAAEQRALPDPTALREAAALLHRRFSTVRDAERDRQREFDRLTGEAAQRTGRIASVDAELCSWRDRAESAATQIAVLRERLSGLDAEAAGLTDRPAVLAEESRQATALLVQARAAAHTAAAGLKEAERRATEADKAAGAASRTLAATREEAIRAAAAHEQAEEARQEASARARGGFECPAEQLPRVAGIPAERGSETTPELEARLETLRRDRAAMGPVNLTADTELAALSAELQSMRAESEDLVAAIARLRQGIQQLNREGAERLSRAFETVNGHFRTLFVRLFGGGMATLELRQDERDPLGAGLEIMASPPGKKPQILSLLSGGERALTALALVFAVFLTNPAPICVLDEVDAPLDDANVERFCALVREIGGRTGTRFLIVTHHRVTMARMDRLYGVTMAERGISQLVSVELQTAERLRQTA